MANKYLAAIMSFFIPGLGQAYAGDIKRGIVFFIISVIMALITYLIFVELFYYIVDVFISIYASYDAYLMVE